MTEETEGDKIVKVLETQKDLKSQAKELSDLVITEYFTVLTVISQSYEIKTTKNNNIVPLGGTPYFQTTGYVEKIILNVTPDNIKDVPVETIIFEGNSIVKAGDYISAEIPKYIEKGGEHLIISDKNKVFYIDRDFKPIENAIELAIIAEDGTVLRADRSINYDKFHRK